MTDYSQDAQAVADAINSVYENKQVNKKNDISGDFSSDNASYPTVKAAKAEFGTKVTTFGSTPSDANYPSEKLVATALADKISKSLTSGLVKNDGTIDQSVYLTQHQSLSDIGGIVTVVEKSSPNQGMFKTYQIKQGGSAVGVDIDIPKDYLLKSVTIEECTVADEPVEGYKVGDFYFDFVFNTKDTSASDTHQYLLANDLKEVYLADNVTLQLSNNNTFSIKDSGVDTAQLKDGAVTADKIASSVKSGWWTSASDAAELSAFATALVNAINPPSS